MFQRLCGVFALLFAASGLYAQAAAAPAAYRTDGENVYYYDTLFEAFAVSGGSLEFPLEITLLADLVLDEPIVVADGVHIRLVAGGSDRIIRRGGGNIEFPVIWVKGDGASLTLGKPDMEYDLIFDGGYAAGGNGSIKAHTPLAAVSGPDARLIMYDGLTLQNNYNNGDGPSTDHYRNGAGVFIRTEGDNQKRQAEFIMRGGTIRGNFNDLQHPVAYGGGVFIAGFGIFTMEGGVIMDNTAFYGGGGFHTGSRGSFKKTGGIIYGKNAPAGLRNTGLHGTGYWPKTYGHALIVAFPGPPDNFRDDTVYENDRLTFYGTARPEGSFIYGEGERWSNSDKVLQRTVLLIILAALVFCAAVILIVTKIVLKKRLAKIMQIAEAAPEVDFEGLNLSDKEMEICKLLLTELSVKQIAPALKLSESGVNYHAQKIYRKLGIQSRPELFVKLLKK